jgi:transposase
LGNLIDFRLMPGQAHDLRAVPELIECLRADHLLADSAFDADWLRTALDEQEITPVIPPKSNRRFVCAVPAPLGFCLRARSRRVG